MGIHVKKENTNAIIIYINTKTRDYTVPPLARYHREHSDATSCLSSCINSVDKKIINRLHAITHDWHLPRSCFLPLAKQWAPLGREVCSVQILPRVYTLATCMLCVLTTGDTCPSIPRYSNISSDPWQEDERMR